MSGTSIDGIDAALVAVGEDSVKQLDHHSQDYPQKLKSAIANIAAGANDSLHELATADREIGVCFAEAANTLLRKANLSADDIRAIGSHGQTVRHRPELTPSSRYTIQIGDPATIAEHTGIDTVADFRRQDLVAGGEGAPLAPAFHGFQFAGQGRRVIVNIGGISNATLLDGSVVTAGFDCGPGNTLLDAWTREHLGTEFDENGAWSAENDVDRELLTRLQSDPYFQRTGPKSTGPEHFNLQWLNSLLTGNEIAGEVQATLAELTAGAICDAILSQSEQQPEDVYICGGGARNVDLMRRMHTKLDAHDVRLGTTDDLGLAAEWVEACAFAWLASQRINGLSGNVPSVTGANGPRLLGAVYAAPV